MHQSIQKRERERVLATRHQIFIWWPICNNSTKIICLSGWWCWLWYTDMMCPSHFFEAVLDCWLDGCGIDAVGVRRWIRVKTYYPYIYLIDIRRASICWRVLKCLQKWFDLFGCFENCVAWLNPTYTRTQRFGCKNQSVCPCNARPESNSRFARARLALAAHRDWILWRKDVWRLTDLEAAWDFSLCSCCSPESWTNTDCCCTYRTCVASAVVVFNWNRRLTLFSVVLGMNLCVFKLRCQFPAWFEDS